jgi:hypothetical protein
MPETTPGLGEFVMRVKVAREDGSPRIEPFTLAVFGRKSQIINLGGVL